MQASDDQGDHDAEPDPHSRQADSVAHDLRHDVSAARPEREPDPDLTPPLPYGVRQEPVDADARQHPSGHGEAAEQPGVELAARRTRRAIRPSRRPPAP